MPVLTLQRSGISHQSSVTSHWSLVTGDWSLWNVGAFFPISILIQLFNLTYSAFCGIIKVKTEKRRSLFVRAILQRTTLVARSLQVRCSPFFQALPQFFLFCNEETKKMRLKNKLSSIKMLDQYS